MDGDEQKQKQKQTDPSAANDSTISPKNRIDRSRKRSDMQVSNQL